MNDVEDEQPGRPFDPAKAATDGRLYPPLWDNTARDPARANVWRLRSARHVTFIGDNGGIEIYDLVTCRTIFDKAGADGRQLGESPEGDHDSR